MSDMEIQTNDTQVVMDTKPTREKKPPEHFTKIQSIMLILFTLIVSAGGWFLAGKYYFWNTLDMKRVEAQLNYYQQQVKAQPNNVQNIINLGYTYYLLGKTDQAVAQYNQALAIDKKSFDAYYNLGLVYNDTNRLDDALEMFQKSVELSPRDFKGHMEKGVVYRKLKMYNDALKELNQANKLNPARADIIYEIGMVAEAQGNNDLAAQIYKDALSYDPLYKDAVKALDRVQKAK
jgi:tetratricopeptide (TPR) repeat protein